MSTKSKSFKSFEVVYEAETNDDGGVLILNDLGFCSNKIGWAVGTGQVLRSRDGGKTWESRLGNLNLANVAPYRVVPIDASTCWVTSKFSPDGESLYKTVNGGVYWRRAEQPLHAVRVALHFVNANLGWIVADCPGRYDSSFSVFSTTTAGEEWEQCASMVIEENEYPLRLQFESVQSGFLLSGSDIRHKQRHWNLYATRDGGRQWKLTAEFDEPVNTFFATGAELYVGTEAGEVLVSRNAGKTWNRVAQLGDPVHALTIDNRGYGFAAGDSTIVLVRKGSEATWEPYCMDDRSTGFMNAHFSGGSLVFANALRIYSVEF